MATDEETQGRGVVWRDIEAVSGSGPGTATTTSRLHEYHVISSHLVPSHLMPGSCYLEHEHVRGVGAHEGLDRGLDRGLDITWSTSMCAALAQAGGPVIVTTRFVVPSTNYTIHDAQYTWQEDRREGKDSGGEGETGVRGRGRGEERAMGHLAGRGADKRKR